MGRGQGERLIFNFHLAATRSNRSRRRRAHANSVASSPIPPAMASQPGPGVTSITIPRASNANPPMILSTLTFLTFSHLHGPGPAELDRKSLGGRNKTGVVVTPPGGGEGDARKAAVAQRASVLNRMTPISRHPNRIAPTTICRRTKNVSIFTPRPYARASCVPQEDNQLSHLNMVI